MAIMLESQGPTSRVGLTLGRRPDIEFSKIPSSLTGDGPPTTDTNRRRERRAQAADNSDHWRGSVYPSFARCFASATRSVS